MRCNVIGAVISLSLFLFSFGSLFFVSLIQARLPRIRTHPSIGFVGRSVGSFCFEALCFHC